MTIDSDALKILNTATAICRGHGIRIDTHGLAMRSLRHPRTGRALAALGVEGPDIQNFDPGTRRVTKLPRETDALVQAIIALWRTNGGLTADEEDIFA